MRQHATDHEIYRKREKTNIGLGLILATLVLLTIAGSIAKFSLKAAAELSHYEKEETVTK